MVNRKTYLDASTLPRSRKQQFFDILRHEFPMLLKLGGILVAFAIPLLLSIILKEIFISNLAGNIDFETEKIKFLTGVRNITVIIDLANIVSFAVFFIGLAGVIKVIKTLIFGEKVNLFSSLKTGIKENWVQYVLVSLFVSILIAVFHLALTTANLDGNKVFSYASWIMLGIFLFTIAPSLMLALSFIATYKNKFSTSFKNGFILYISTFKKYVLFTLVIAIGWIGFVLLNTLSSSLTLILAITVFVILLVLPILLLANYAFSFDYFDKTINKDYPEIWHKGIEIAFEKCADIPLFKSARWIWASDSENVDDYAEFKIPLKTSESHLTLRISCDTSYAVYLNGQLIKFMGCFDYPTHKFYDCIDLDNLESNNDLIIDVWHQGYGSHAYFNSDHGLIFEIINNVEVVLSSSSLIKSRVKNEFKNNYKKVITVQQGLSFLFDNTVKPSEFTDSILIDKKCNFFLRDIANIKLLDRNEISITEKENSIVVDLGRETSGLLDLDIDSPKKSKLTICYGECLKDGSVKRIIGERDFSIEFIAKKGNNKFINPLKRIAGRYLEIFYDEKPTINYIGIRPCNIEHEVIRKDYGDDLINKINNVCIDTLELCMHEHYEDCPWREQCLYILDSMNQMSSGYRVFKDYTYPRHNIELISQGLNQYGFLSLCAPTSYPDLCIPFFNLMFIKTVSDYIDETGDESILKIASKPIESIIEIFKSRITEKHLIKYFNELYCWNFYEWVQESADEVSVEGNKIDRDQYDLIMNCAYVYAVNYYNKMFDEKIDVDETIQAIQDTFYDKERNVYILNTSTKSFSQLGCSLACLIGLGNNELLEKIKSDKEMIQASLSVRNFVYDALLLDYSNKDFVIEDIKSRYSKMLDKGATSFWETEEGEEAFGSAGSLCHGWSTIPVYYFDMLL